MTTTWPAPVAHAYDEIATAYDLLTGDYDYDRWLAELLALARRHGLHGRRVLDVACGTGHSFLPLLRRGFEVTACDISAGMAAIARRKAAGLASVSVADMRRLPRFGEFDLVTCLGDALNHLVDEKELAAAFRGMRRNLAPGGLAVFDLNLLGAYRDVPDVVEQDEDRVILWSGGCARIEQPGGRAELVLDVFRRRGDVWLRTTTRQPHCHHPLSAALRVAREASLEIADAVGQEVGARLSGPADEDRHPKAIVVARRFDPDRHLRKEESMPWRP